MMLAITWKIIYKEPSYNSGMKQHDDTYKRIDSLVNIKMQDDVLHAFAAMMKDLLDDEPFEPEDIVKYMAIRMQEMTNEHYDIVSEPKDHLSCIDHLYMSHW